ncbi:MAG: helix-turn-helix domain-containing protein [Thermoleophilaceae bacterium]
MSSPPAGQRLPRGRHGLTRDEVVGSQRSRLLRALAETMAEKGYAQTSVADVLRSAGVSRETFYEQFSSKADCFMTAYETAVELVLAGMPATPAEGGDRLERFDRAIGAYLDALAAEPAFARLFLLEVYAAGPAALARRAEAQARFVERLSRLLGPRDATERFAVEALVAAVSSMVTAKLAAGDVDGLRALRTPVCELVSRALPGG